MENTRYHMIVHGGVHGVFFRHNAVKFVEKTGGITGYVKNLPDGTVEIVAEGEEPRLKLLVGFCGKIWFNSKENKGSKFYVSIPLAGMKKKVGSKRLTWGGI